MTQEYHSFSFHGNGEDRDEKHSRSGAEDPGASEASLLSAGGADRTDVRGELLLAASAVLAAGGRGTIDQVGLNAAITGKLANSQTRGNCSMKHTFFIAAAALLLAGGARAEDRTVSLQAANGKFVVAEGGGGGDLNANRDRPDIWETFTIEDKNGGRLMSKDAVCIRTWHNYYVVAEGGGGGEARANRDRCREWETFQILKVNADGWPILGEIEIGGRVAFKTHNGHFLVAEGGGGREVRADRPAMGAWEIFTVRAAP